MNSGQTRMNTAPQYHSRFFRVAPFQSKMRNGMEEVVGSIPTRSTIFPITYGAASRRPLLHSMFFASYFFSFFFSTFAQVSFKAAVRLNTGRPGFESGSTQKYPRRSNW